MFETHVTTCTTNTSNIICQAESCLLFKTVCKRATSLSQCAAFHMEACVLSPIGTMCRWKKRNSIHLCSVFCWNWFPPSQAWMTFSPSSRLPRPTSVRVSPSSEPAVSVGSSSRAAERTELSARGRLTAEIYQTEIVSKWRTYGEINVCICLCGQKWT